MLPGSATLVGLLRERLARRSADEKEKRRDRFSFGVLLVSLPNCVKCLSGVAVIVVEALDLVVTRSGSWEPSREVGAESVRDEEAYIRHHISISTGLWR